VQPTPTINGWGDAPGIKQNVIIHGYLVSSTREGIELARWQ
jgi:hypothetical protein